MSIPLPENLPEEVKMALQEVVADEIILSEGAFFFAFNHQTKKIPFVSYQAQRILGYKAEQLQKESFAAMARIIHTEDLKPFIRHQKKLWHNLLHWPMEKQMQLRLAQDVRVKGEHQQQVRLLIQQQIVKTSENIPHWSVGVCLDITHIKSADSLSLAVFNFEGKQLNLEKIVGWSKERLFTDREADVLRLLSRGYKSKDIEKILSISLHTVRTHRRNMLKKTGLANTTQLVNFAASEGLLKEVS